MSDELVLNSAAGHSNTFGSEPMGVDPTDIPELPVDFPVMALLEPPDPDPFAGIDWQAQHRMIMARLAQDLADDLMVPIAKGSTVRPAKAPAVERLAASAASSVGHQASQASAESLPSVVSTVRQPVSTPPVSTPSVSAKRPASPPAWPGTVWTHRLRMAQYGLAAAGIVLCGTLLMRIVGQQGRPSAMANGWSTSGEFNTWQAPANTSAAPVFVPKANSVTRPRQPSPKSPDTSQPKAGDDSPTAPPLANEEPIAPELSGSIP